MREADNAAKQVLREAKETSWQNYVNTIHSKSPIGQVWKRIKGLHSSYRPHTSPLLVGNNLITNNADKCTAFADYFCQVFAHPHGAGPAARGAFEPQMFHEGCLDCSAGYNKLITMEELQDIISGLQDTSPGCDDIPNSMLKQLPDNYLQYMLCLFNKVWIGGVLPSEWKEALIIPIHKFGKSEQLPESFRPISLLPCVGKVFERIVGNRLYWFVEHNKKLSASQGGFRRRCNTTDQVARVERIIRETYLNREVCLVVFVDLKGAYDRVNHNRLLEKLYALGVRGHMLAYCTDFLQGRKFKTLYNGEYSDAKSVGVGVPQGASISPLFFNIFMRDIPDVNGVVRTEYADDIAFVARGENIQECTLATQQALDSFYVYCQENGLEVNYQKTFAMFFTRKHVAPIPLTINQFPIDFVQTFKFLGVTFDSPYLNWKAHIGVLKEASLKRLNILKAIAHKDWGSDRMLLLCVYKALLLSKLNFGAEFYSSASDTSLKVLDTIQSAALRLCLGVRQTSPVCSMEVEAHIPPLALARDKIIMSYFNRFRHLPVHLDVVCELSDNLDEQIHRPYTLTTPAPLLVRCHKLLGAAHLEVIDSVPFPLVSLTPPWDKQKWVHPFMVEEPVKLLSPLMVQTLFRNKSRNYNDHVHIYTDGSKKVGEDDVVSAAYVVPTQGVSQGWKLPSHLSIMTAELFAIYMALEWFVGQDQAHGVIFTDSLSSVSLLTVTSTGKLTVYSYLVQRIQTELARRSRSCSICWIPSHCGIPGNEAADKAARDASRLTFLTWPNLSRLDVKSMIRCVGESKWKNHWDSVRARNQVGNHLYSIKNTISRWPWASIPSNRRLESCMARLRVGHCGVRSHLFRFGLFWSPLCNCGIPETISHVFISCAEHAVQRAELIQQLSGLDVDFSLKNVLGGGAYSALTQRMIVTLVGKFLADTRKLLTL
jgi:ribonuclease HI